MMKSRSVRAIKYPEIHRRKLEKNGRRESKGFIKLWIGIFREQANSLLSLYKALNYRSLEIDINCLKKILLMRHDVKINF